MWPTDTLFDPERRGGANISEPLGDRVRQLRRINLGHAAAIAASQQSLYGDHPVRQAQALLDYLKDHRSHPE